MRKSKKQIALALKRTNRRYYLHQKIKKDYKYNPVTKTIFAPYNEVINNPYIDELTNNYQYTIQLEIT